MDPLLLYFREDYLELLSMDSNGRIVPVNFQSTNKIPLYFLINGEQVQMDTFAKIQFFENSNQAYGDFWENTGNTSLTYNRFQKNYTFDTLLPYALKENILPSILKSYFHFSNFSEFLLHEKTFVLFDSFVNESQREIVNSGLLEIVGFQPNNLVILDFWELFRNYRLNNKETILLLNASLVNIYIHLIGFDSPYQLSKHVIKGKGGDPRVDTILDYIAEKARMRGSYMPINQIKKILINEAPIVLSKLKNGLVRHTISNNILDVSPLRLDFHSSEVESRLNNRQSLNFIQNEFDNFRKNNNAIELKIYLYGEILNQEVFVDFFKSTYANVNTQTNDFDELFLTHTLKVCLSQVTTNQKTVLMSPGLSPSFPEQGVMGRTVSPPPLPTNSKTTVSAPPIPGSVKPLVLPPIPNNSRPPVPPPIPSSSRPPIPPPEPGLVRSVSPPPFPVGNKNVPPVVPPPQNVQNGTKGDVKPAKNKVNIPPPPPPPPIASNKGTTGNKEKKTTQKKNTVSKVTDSNNLKPKKTQIELILKKFYSNLMVADSQTKSKVFLNGNIHQTKYMNMMNKLGLSIPYSECLFQYDDTLFGAGDNGILITEKYFIWRNLGDSGKYITWNDIVKFSVNGNIKIILHDNTGVIHSIDNGMIRKSLLFAGCFSDILKLYKS